MAYDDFEPAPPRGRQTSGRSSARGPAQPRTRDDYIEVKDRVVEFYGLFPEGRIVPSIIERTETLVRARAEVYRDSDPGGVPAGVGHSDMEIPGKTTFTRGSETENAETSAVGRALAFAGISAHRGVATLSEILSKRGDEPPPSPSPREPRGDPPGPQTPTDPSADAAGQENTSEAVPVKAVAPSPPEPAAPDPELVDPETGEVVGLTQDQFGEQLKVHLIPMRSAHQAFERLYPGTPKADATPAQRLAALNDAIAQSKQDVPA